jgi:O-antigen/teichoic acid export membrane protein
MKLSAPDFTHRLLPIGLSQAFGLACGLAGVQLTSRFVAPADLGAYGVFMSLALVGVSVIYAGLVKFVSRHWQAATDRPALVREILRATLRKSLWLLAAVAVATLLVAPPPRLAYGWALLGCAFLLALVQLMQSSLQAAREHWRDFGLSVSQSLTRSFAPPLLYRATGAGLLALLAGFFVHTATALTAGALLQRRWWRTTGTAPTTPQLTSVYDGPRFVILAAAAWILTGLNRWLVAAFYGTETAGYFTLAMSVGAILPTVIGMSLLQFAQPQWFAAPTGTDAEKRRLLREVDRLALLQTVLSVAAAVTVQLAMPLLIGPLVNARYTAAIGFVAAAGCWATALSTGMYYHATLLAARRERDCTRVDLGSAAVLIALASLGAAINLRCFALALLVSPLVPLLVNRPLARRAVLAPGAASTAVAPEPPGPAESVP